MNRTKTTLSVLHTSAARRMAISVCVAMPLALAWAAVRPAIESALVGWCIFAGTNLLLGWLCIRHANPHETQTSVASYDQSSAAMLTTVIVGAAISVAAIAYLLATSKDSSLVVRVSHILLSVTSIALSWLLMHARFGFHYAHCYYRKYANAGDDPAFNFPGKHAPDYLDFMYFSYVLGMTSQVSDVTINTRAMRRLALLHGLISFAFNLMIVAFFINVVGTVFATG